MEIKVQNIKNRNFEYLVFQLPAFIRFDIFATGKSVRSTCGNSQEGECFNPSPLLTSKFIDCTRGSFLGNWWKINCIVVPTWVSRNRCQFWVNDHLGNWAYDHTISTEAPGSWCQFWVNDHIGVGVIDHMISTRDHYLWKTIYQLLLKPVTINNQLRSWSIMWVFQFAIYIYIYIYIVAWVQPINT